MNKYIVILIGMFLLFPFVSSAYATNILTLQAEEITSNTAILRGEVLDIGETTYYLNSTDNDPYVISSFYYKKLSETEWNKTDDYNIFNPVVYESNIDNLEPNTLYVYKFSVDTGTEVYNGSIRNFVTEPIKNIFSMDLDKTPNMVLLILFFCLGVVLVFLKYYMFSSIIFLVLAFILFVNRVSLVLGLISLGLGVFFSFVEGGEK